MRTLNTYASIDGVQSPSVSLHWHVLAFFSPWMILGGFLVLPHLFGPSDEPLRTNPTALVVLATISITAGFGATMFLTIICPSWSFVLESVLLPAFSATSLALLSFLFDFVISERYQWKANAIVSTTFAILLLVYFACLSLYAHRKVLQLRPRAAGQSTRWICPNPLRRWWRQRVGPCFDQSPRLEPAYAEAPVEVIHHPDDPEEEAQRQQMMNLLQRSRMTSHQPLPQGKNSYSTYQINFKYDADDTEAGETAPPLLLAASSSTPQPRQQQQDQDQQQQQQQPQTRHQKQDSLPRRPEESRHNRQPSSSRRQQATPYDHYRSASMTREDRRREIELGRWG